MTTHLSRWVFEALHISVVGHTKVEAGLGRRGCKTQKLLEGAMQGTFVAAAAACSSNSRTES